MKRLGILFLILGAVGVHIFWSVPVQAQAGDGCYCEEIYTPGKPPTSGLVTSIKSPSQCSGDKQFADGTTVKGCQWVEANGCQCVLPNGGFETVDSVVQFEDCNGSENLQKINTYFNGTKGYLECQWVGAGGPPPSSPPGKITSCEEVCTAYDCTYKSPNVLKTVTEICTAIAGCSFNTETKTCEKAKASAFIPDVSPLNPIGTTDPKQFIGRVIKIGMGILGSITLAMFVISGVLWMTSAGNSDRADQAKKILVWSSLGIIVILSSYALVKFLFEIVQ